MPDITAIQAVLSPLFPGLLGVRLLEPRKVECSLSLTFVLTSAPPVVSCTGAHTWPSQIRWVQ